MKTWKRGIVVLMALAVAVSGAFAQSKTFKLKLGHVASTSAPYAMAAVKFADLVKAATDGHVIIEVYPNSVLGSSRDLIEGLQIGTMDATLTTTAVLANFLPKSQVIELPFMFKSREQVYKVLDGPIADEIFAGAESKGLKVVSTWENGFRNITNDVRPIVTPADVKGLKIRVMESQMYIDMFKALGANPTPISYGELFTALQQKTVDGQENPLDHIYTDRFYEVQKYLTLTGHTYAPEVLVFSLGTWKKLPPEYQAAIAKAAAEARDYDRKLSAEKDGEYLKLLQDKGMQVITLTPSQIAAFSDLMKPVWEKYYKVIGKDLIDKIANYSN